MSRGISIHIGLDRIRSGHYGTEGRLKGCENDAKFMYDLAVSRNFKAQLLLTEDATYTNVRDAIIDAGENLEDDGILLITYSGHGGQAPDVNRNEADGFDETWCLYNQQMVDDELFELMTRFKKNQKILIISDSCHSGTVADTISGGFSDVNNIQLGLLLGQEGFRIDNFNNETSEPLNSTHMVWERILPQLEEREIDLINLLNTNHTYNGLRSLPKTVFEVTYSANKIFYEDKQQASQDRLEATAEERGLVDVDFRELLRATVILISACQDWQLAGEKAVDENGQEKYFGIFTHALKEVWQNGGQTKNYLQLHEAIWEKLQTATLPNRRQHPNYSKIGSPNPIFETQSGFTI